MDNLNAIPLFQRHLDTLKKTSKDEHEKGQEQYLTESTMEAINFDDVKCEYITGLHLSDTPRSCDALFQHNQCLYFVEFKGGYIDNPKKYEVWEKIYNSVLIVSDVMALRMSDLRKEAEFVLVYSEDKNSENTDEELKEKNRRSLNSPSYTQIAKDVNRFAKDELICFGLGKYQNYCFRRIHTYTEKEFEDFLNRLGLPVS